MKTLKQYLPESWLDSNAVEPALKENAEELNIGDDVIITGPVEFKGETGVISDFGSGKSFVVVNLYNHGKQSFHSSDVSFNDYADSDEEAADMYDRDPDARNWGEHDLDEAKKAQKPAYTFQKIDYDQFERAAASSSDYDEDSVNGFMIGTAYNGKNCIAVYYIKAQYGSYCPEFVGDAMDFTDADTNYPSIMEGDEVAEIRRLSGLK